MLRVEGFAQLDAGDLGDGIGLVGGFERTGEQVLFANRLRAIARVDAARAEEDQPLHAGAVRALDEVGLDLQVLVEEVGALHVVGQDAADLGRSDEDEVRALRVQEIEDGALVEQVELGARARDELGVARRLQRTLDGAAHHAAVAGDKDTGAAIHVVPPFRQALSACARR